MNIEQEKQHWGQLYGRPISNEEYSQICENLKEFFSTLKSWDKAERKSNEDVRSGNNRSKHISNTP